MLDGAPREVKSTCCYCGVGCGVLITTEAGRITGVRGDPEHPANFGKLCSKGSTLHLTARPDLDSIRATVPMVRTDRAAARVPADWDATLELLTDRFADTIAKHGPDSVAFYLSGQLLTEDYYVFNKITKGLIGTNNVDTNSRLCMSSAVAGYKQTLGADAPPCSYEDIDSAQVLFIAGSNTAYAHPILYRRIEVARARNPELKVVVVDPRRTETAREADLHLAIQPGTDIALFNGMLHVMLWEGLLDTAYIAAHTEGFDALKATVREYTPKMAAELCGIAEADLVQAAQWFAQSSATLSLYCQGLNQSSSGTAKNAALINLHLATGQIGKPGAGPFSLTGQPNAMGGREVGGLANLISAHRDMANAAHRAEVAKLWGVDDVPAAPGKTAVEMFDAIAAGTIKAVWIVCTNPAQSLPNQAAVHAALRTAEFVVVQDAYQNTETAKYADVLLPASSWGEKEGTVTNSERRITRLHQAIDPPGEARADWVIARDFAQALEARLRPDRPSLFNYPTAESVWNEHRESTRGRDLDITGLSYATLTERGPQQWPMPAGATSGRVRLYEDGIFSTANGRARFANTAYKPLAEPIDARYPFRLNTGRLRDQWHAMSRTGSIAQLYNHAPEPTIALSPDDIAKRGFTAGDLVRVESRRGATTLLLEASDELRPGHAFIAMHWGARFLGGTDSYGVNTLTVPAFDPVSKQPELKHTAIRISKAELGWRCVAVAIPRDGSAIALADRVAELGSQFAFASVVLTGRDREAVLVRLGATKVPPAQAITALDALLGLDDPSVIRYDDPQRAISRRIAVTDHMLQGVRLSGPIDATAAQGWLRDWLVRGTSVATIRRMLLAPTATAPAGFAPRGKVVCNCFDVSAVEIDAALVTLAGPPGARLAALQAKLSCGTSCGSCIPELKARVHAAAVAAESTPA